jgi:hypothetical protein
MARKHKLVRILVPTRTGHRSRLNDKEAKYMFMSCDENAGQNYNIMIANKLFESLAKLK